MNGATSGLLYITGIIWSPLSLISRLSDSIETAKRFRNYDDHGDEWGHARNWKFERKKGRTSAKSAIRLDLASTSRFLRFFSRNKNGLKIVGESFDLCNTPIRVRETELNWIVAYSRIFFRGWREFS